MKRLLIILIVSIFLLLFVPISICAGSDDGIITWGTFNSSVTIVIGETTTSPGAEEEPNPAGVVPHPTEPTGWYSSCAALASLPFHVTFTNAALAMGMPDPCVLYLMVMIALAIAVGLSVMIFTGSVLASTIMAGSFLSVCVGTTIVGGWMVFVFIVIAGGTIYLARTA
jgi:hypothetical protein